jgi:uncharacterized Zn finger protein
MDETLADLLNKEVLMELAGERAFDRGADYFADRQVVGLQETDGTITGRVRGTYYYRVKLWADDGELAFECNCPVGPDGVFCKHCVAVGLAWLDQSRPNVYFTRKQTKRDVTDEEIRAHLTAQDKRSLVELLMDHADWDSDLRDRLVLTTAQRERKSPDLAAFRGAIDKAIHHRVYVDYGRMPEYARGIEAVVESLGDLLKRGHANEVRELTERALKQMESAMNAVDDSDGFMSGILDRLQELHLFACRAATPDPRALAKLSTYEEAVDILRKIRELMARIGKQAEFESLVESIRAQYKPRRNLMKLLDAQGWS